MAKLNQIQMTVTGNTSTIEYRTSRNGTTFANFSVAQDASVLGKDGKWGRDDDPTWIRCVAVGEIAEHMRQSGMVKGVRVTVTGTFESRSYQDQRGQKSRTYELHATDVAASLRFATVTISKAQTANGFAGRQTQPAPQQAPAQPAYQPQQPAPQPPAGDGWTEAPAQPQTAYTQPAYNDGFAQAGQDQPQI